MALQDLQPEGRQSTVVFSCSQAAGQGSYGKLSAKMAHSPAPEARSRSGSRGGPKGPIFLLGPTSKSGTNFFLNLLVELELARLPAVDPLTREDHFLFHANLLSEYVEKTVAIWDSWEEAQTVPEDNAAQLLRCLGEGLLRFFGPPGGLPMIVKTPATRNLARAPDLFPDATFLLIVRDGRDATESGVLSEYWAGYEEAFEEWAQGVRDLLEFTGGPGARADGPRWALLSYERLVREPESELQTAARLLGADPDALDLTVIEKLPVFGSTDYGRNADSGFEWRVAPRTRSFNPFGRWHSWDDATKDLFKKIAGDELIALGYEKDSSW